MLQISVPTVLMRKLAIEKLSVFPKVMQQGAGGRRRTWNPGLSVPKALYVTAYNGFLYQ